MNIYQIHDYTEHGEPMEIMKHKHLTPIEQKHLKNVRRKLRRYEKVVFCSGFVATRAEIKWAKKALKEQPEDFDCIEDVIAFKRSYDEAERGEGTDYWYENNY